MAKAKLRKMLGSAEHPIVLQIKAVIDTQSKETLAAWAADYAEENFLPIYMKAYQTSEDAEPFVSAIKAVRACLAGELKVKDIKPPVKAAQLAAREADASPAAQAAARALATAVGVLQTPTNSLGFTFYGAAALTYDKLGAEEAPETYDAAADDEFQKMLDALKAVAIEDEPNPVKLKWGC